eukprot:CAMPEP_0197021364 /NCGR_PEP_ID=MMETSP1384-20130603/2231_1 /TAXON_ID=29189 /ORGANISM="Ammonia sp." /LENGTH=386 /DNA_ID=CAMNT_0042449173 /DNA_START=50 /DNA_END=1206 /DNA_ORIENTATION=-
METGSTAQIPNVLSRSICTLLPHIDEHCQATTCMNRYDNTDNLVRPSLDRNATGSPTLSHHEEVNEEDAIRIQSEMTTMQCLSASVDALPLRLEKGVEPSHRRRTYSQSTQDDLLQEEYQQDPVLHILAPDKRANSIANAALQPYSAADVYDELGGLYLHRWVDGQDECGKWYEAQIVGISPDNNKLVKLHYKGLTATFDDGEWVDLQSEPERVRVLHTFTKRPPNVDTFRSRTSSSPYFGQLVREKVLKVIDTENMQSNRENDEDRQDQWNVYQHFMKASEKMGAECIGMLRIEKNRKRNLLVYANLLSSMKHKNERYLFHGTAIDNVEPIIVNGFNRDYNRAARLGKGTYFAKSADFAAKYAKKDERWNAWALLACRCIVGKSG